MHHLWSNLLLFCCPSHIPRLPSLCHPPPQPDAPVHSTHIIRHHPRVWLRTLPRPRYLFWFHRRIHLDFWPPFVFPHPELQTPPHSSQRLSSFYLSLPSSHACNHFFFYLYLSVTILALSRALSMLILNFSASLSRSLAMLLLPYNIPWSPPPPFRRFTGFRPNFFSSFS
jgi:hypothetical protein